MVLKSGIVQYRQRLSAAALAAAACLDVADHGGA